MTMSTALSPLEALLATTTFVDEDRPANGVQADEWQTAAACKKVNDASIFFSDNAIEVAQAKRICADCEVLAPCLEGALERRESAGVWGGQLFVKGQIVTIKRGRGRPRKSPRPEEVQPEVPIPAYLQQLIA